MTEQMLSAQINISSELLDLPGFSVAFLTYF